MQLQVAKLWSPQKEITVRAAALSLRSPHCTGLGYSPAACILTPFIPPATPGTPCCYCPPPT